MPRQPEYAAPAVRIRRTRQIVLLLEWELTRRGWRAHVAWLVRQYGWRGMDIWLPADDLEQVPGEDYRHVPRRRADDLPF